MARTSGSRAPRRCNCRTSAPATSPSPPRLCERRNLGGQEADAMSGHEAGHCRIAHSRDSTIRVAARPCVGMLGTWTPDPPPPYADRTTTSRASPRAIEYIADHALEQPSLADIAAAADWSEYHLRACSAAGPASRRSSSCSTSRSPRPSRRSTTNGPCCRPRSTGLSGPGRLHDLFVSLEAVTPGDTRHAGGASSCATARPRRRSGRAHRADGPRHRVPCLRGCGRRVRRLGTGFGQPSAKRTGSKTTARPRASPRPSWRAAPGGERKLTLWLHGATCSCRYGGRCWRPAPSPRPCLAELAREIGSPSACRAVGGGRRLQSGRPG